MDTGRIIEAAAKVAKTNEARMRIEHVRWAHEYAEPGYDQPKRGGIFFANWNDVSRYEGNERKVDDGTMGRLAAALGTYGARIEWEDEWSMCAQCGRAIRTSPDSYGWQPSYFMTDDGEVCHLCVSEDPAD